MFSEEQLWETSHISTLEKLEAIITKLPSLSKYNFLMNNSGLFHNPREAQEKKVEREKAK